jgi:glycosyltransferase involved in cell wall biosynthesis
MLLSGTTLYLCYFWLDTPLVQTQVLPYLREIAKGGVKVHLLTFEREKLSAEQIEINRQQLADDGITWSFLTYHKRFSVPATFYDVLCGAFFAWKLARKEKIDVFHGRVHIPTMMGWIANKFLRNKPKLLFDIRGFFPEEYVDAGIWKADSIVYKAVKYCEKLLLRDSDGFVVLTEKAREILFPESKETGFDKLGRPVEVIPCCVDLQKFAVVNEDLRNEMRRKLNIENRFVIVYVGSFGGFYMADEVAEFYATAKQQNPNTFALILTQTPKEMIQPLLESKGYTDKDFFIRKVSPKEVPAYLSPADVAISFIKPCYSKLSSSPTKNAEYLACGLPIIANSGVGDVKEHTLSDNVGVIIENFNEEEYSKAMQNVIELTKFNDLSERCRKSAKERYNLVSVGGVKYRQIYKKLTSNE